MKRHYISTLILIFFSFSSLASQGLEEVLFPNIEGVNTDAVIIKKDGKVIYEKYARGYNKDTKHLSWSMAKTISGILIAQAAEDNLLNFDEKISETFNSFQGSANINNLLQMSSGIDFKEEYSGVPIDADVTKMLYRQGTKQGLAHFARTRELKNLTPGEYFYYSSGDTNILMDILKSKMSEDEYTNYPWKKLFNPLSINATFEQDSKGVFVGSSYIYMSPRDYLKIGELIMNKGALGSNQIIPSWYFDMMTQVAPGVKKLAADGTSQTRAYSMQVTTNLPIIERELAPEYSDLPSDSLLLIGHQGQLVISSPSQDLVIVRLATDSRDAPFNRKEFLKEVVKLVTSSGSSMTIASQSHAKLYKEYGEPKKKEKEEKKKKFKDNFEYINAPAIMQRLLAKELCSCLHVVKRDLEQCKADIKISLPSLPFFIDPKKDKDGNDIVKSGYIPGTLSTVIFENEKLGCHFK